MLDEKTAEPLMKFGDSQGKTRIPVARIPGQATPCHKCPKIPKDAPEKTRKHAIELSDKNRRAYNHYLRCRATMSFPDDELVRLHAAVIQQTIEHHHEIDTLSMFAGLKARGANG